MNYAPDEDTAQVREEEEEEGPADQVRRSSRAPTDASPNYAEGGTAEDSEEEGVEYEESEGEDEEGSDPEDEDQEDGDDSEKEEEDEGEDDATAAARMGKWGETFLQEMAYKEEHGHCNVSRKENKSLGVWVKNQRTGHRLWTNGNKSRIREEKIDMLNRIGFKWGNTRAEPPVPWNTRFEELKDHLEMFGNCENLVQSDYNKCSGLGKWISWQRK